VTYKINRPDFNKIPQNIKEQMIAVVKVRMEHIQKRTKDQYASLKNIKKGLFDQYHE